MIVASLFRYFVAAGMINAALFAALLFSRKRNDTTSLLLISFMLLVSFQALLNAFDTRDFFLTFPHLSRISWLQLSLFGPLIYLFTQKVTDGGLRLTLKDALHLLPFLGYLTVLAPWFLQSAQEKRKALMDFDGLSRLDFGWLNQCSLFLITAYLLLSLTRIRQYRKATEDTLSDTSKHRLSWLLQFIYVILGILVISGLGFYGRKWQIPLITHFYHYNYLLVVAMVYWLAGRYLLQPELFTIDHTKEAITPKYRKSGLQMAEKQTLYERLLEHMSVRRPFLEPDLTIFMLAEQLQVSRHHLSQVINEQSGSSFHDFINRFRIEAVKQRLAEPEAGNFSILGIAMDCGFNSKATFNTTFKKLTGMTPSAYQKSCKKRSNPVGTVDAGLSPA
ncbi:helix-turn-helix domain-containing protein [Chitinophaga rhizophila]|uniref:Helix-turn-helix transcriptional regulator n=1 Tax=Chitinophaga rhizophila TaxID=2866212 RepID=A0ABS7G845_9BACT|nr:helix-turn-helix transcriptional regulator [Chitinophaga rhizophila]MBW8683300.1 helix-turn-helix transcriptional regulator [Chitinophaga rhizophila]